MSVFGAGWPGAMLAMLTGYFDESGHPDSGPGLVVAGYISTPQRWLKFEREWEAELSAFGVSGLHMKEFTANRGEFSSWKGNEKRRSAFMSRLIRIIRKRTLLSISSAMLLNDYREVDKIYALSGFVSPYPVCVANVQHKAKLWCKDHGYPSERIRFVYEDGAKHKGESVDLCEKLGFSIPIFEAKGNIRALEAADLIAWELRKIIRDVEGDIFRIRASMKALWDDMPRAWGIYRKEDLIRFCQAQRLPHRSRMA